MRRSLSIPREPIARLRALSLGFALFTCLGNAVMFGLSGPTAPLRLTASAAAVTLAAWCVWGYRRGRFPAWSWIAESALLFVLGAASLMVLRALGVFFAVCQFRALYVPRRQLPWLIAGYA